MHINLASSLFKCLWFILGFVPRRFSFYSSCSWWIFSLWNIVTWLWNGKSLNPTCQLRLEHNDFFCCLLINVIKSCKLLVGEHTLDNILLLSSEKVKVIYSCLILVFCFLQTFYCFSWWEDYMQVWVLCLLELPS